MGDSADVARAYWGVRGKSLGVACPNVSLFRFVGRSGLNIKNARVLELGFVGNHGADLIEFARRGAISYGVDLNNNYIKLFAERYSHITVFCADIGNERLPVDSIDLVYSRDTIYYLDDHGIDFCFSQVYNSLVSGGNFVVQFIEKDILLSEAPSGSLSVNLGGFSRYCIEPIFEDDNPIRFLDVDWLCDLANKNGFLLSAKKTLIESFDNDERQMRVNRYLMFRKI